MPEGGGAKGLDRVLSLGVVKAPISLLATFSKWMAAAWIRTQSTKLQTATICHDYMRESDLVQDKMMVITMNKNTLYLHLHVSFKITE